MESINYENVAQQLIECVPELRDEYKSEVDYYGDISNYVFFGPILTKFLIVLLKDNSDKEIIGRIFTYIEKCTFSTDKRVIDLIYAGFLEQILGYENYKLFLEYMGANTKKMLSQFELE